MALPTVSLVKHAGVKHVERADEQMKHWVWVSPFGWAPHEARVVLKLQSVTSKAPAGVPMREALAASPNAPIGHSPGGIGCAAKMFSIFSSCPADLPHLPHEWHLNRPTLFLFLPSTYSNVSGEPHLQSTYS